MAKSHSPKEESLVKIPIGEIMLEGNLIIPENAKGIVLFAHGSGSGRFSPRNQYVAATLQKAGIATLLIDLLTEEEEAVDMETGHLRFDIEFLAERLTGAAEWLRKNARTKKLAIGYFGASTGAGAALIAAARHPNDVYAIVSRGGRPDLAARFLPKVKAPTLLIVGGNDEPVIQMNKGAMKHLRSVKKLEIIPNATHLFEEPGTLEEVARLATEWFVKCLR